MKIDDVLMLRSRMEQLKEAEELLNWARNQTGDNWTLDAVALFDEAAISNRDMYKIALRQTVEEIMRKNQK